MKPTDEEYLQHLDDSIKEVGRGGYQAEVSQEFRHTDYLCYHTHNSQHSPSGFPDIVLAGGARIIAIELKVGNNKPTAQQRGWLFAFSQAGALTFCLWPRHRPVIQRLARGAWFDDPVIRERLHVYEKRG